MMASRDFAGLKASLIVSILLHAGLVLLPSQLFDFFYPTEAYVPDQGRFGVLVDFAPNYEVVDRAPESQPELDTDVPVILEVEEDEALAETPAQASADAAGRESGQVARDGVRMGLGIAEPEPQFFPPVPRYIVPPDFEDLGIRSIRLDLRILVSTTGEPVEILLPDTLTNEEVRYRVLVSAKRFRFEPARKGDRPVSSWIDLPLVLESTESD